MITDSKRVKKYRKLRMKLNTGTDQDILAWLDRQESKQGAIKQLIREEIRRSAQ